MRFVSSLHNEEQLRLRQIILVEEGSNTSTVTLRIVGGDKEGSLKSETVKYSCEPNGLGPEKAYIGEGQHMQKTNPSSRQRGSQTKRTPKLSKSNKYLTMSPI
jgi:hypothetical protein